MTDVLLDESDAGKGGSTPPPAASGNSAPPAPAASTTPPPGASWRDSLPEDLRKEPSLSTFIDVTALAKSHVEVQKLVGKKGVIVPGENASDAELDYYYNSLGRPPTLDKYEIKGPDGVEMNKDVLTEFRDVFFKTGILPKQANEILKKYAEFEKGLKLKSTANSVEQNKLNIATLKKEWGDGFEKNKMAANQFASEALSEKTIKKLKDANLINDPDFINDLVKAKSKFMKEHGLQGENKDNLGLTPREAQEKINEVMSHANDRAHPYFNASHPAHKDWLSKVEGYFKALAPQAG